AKENRALEQRPKLTISGIESGRWMKQYESYVSDQFAGRDFWVALKSRIDLIAGKRKANGVFKGKDHYLLEDIARPDEEQLKANLDAMKKFQETYKDIPMYMMLVPNAANIESDKLPYCAVTEDQDKQFQKIKASLGTAFQWVNVEDTLKKHRAEEIYYHTDHHWTTQGAFYMFKDTASLFGIKGDVSDDYVSYTVTDDFNGVLASKSGCGLDEKEKIDIYAPTNGDDDVIVNYVNETKKTTSLYDSSKLKTRDKYGVFLGGNTSVIDIKTVSTSQKRLLVVKDSFADCFIPFLTPHYREIVVVDPRYYSGTMQDIMDTYRITDALILYSGNTFFTDNNISGVFTGE
ncbi:MAG: hypothetical protein EGS34_03045, partial [[Ruminococcus] torques]|uniref:DHHW family protein n=1 Tax=[Ruminococcus] torques TaxID=33039 RepID=UPI00241E8595